MGWVKKSIFSWLGLMGVALYASEKWVTWTLLITGITALAILDNIKRNYWKKRGITQAQGGWPIFGHMLGVFNTTDLAWEPMDKGYKLYKEFKYMGSYMFWSPQLTAMDPEIIKHIMIKDFDHFVDRRSFAVVEEDSWAREMLTLAEGSHWKGIRSVLSPTFSSGKMKNMFPLVVTKADALMKKLHKITGNGESSLDMKKYLGQLTVDVIASCAFGFESNCIEAEDVEFEKMLSKANIQGLGNVIKGVIAAIAPKYFTEYFDFSVMSNFRYFKDLTTNIIEQRRKTDFKRGDFVDLILEAQAAQEESGSTQHEISEDTVIGSAVVFLLAGYDTVLNTLVIAAHVIAQHPDEQEKLRQELREIVDEHGSINYQNIMEAKYLEAIIFETQRMYPIAPLTERKCTKDYLLPGTNTILEKGYHVTIPIWSLQNDESYWKEPSKFNPDRFLPENKGDIIQGTFMPFGAGPRNCIAMRFALMELKVAIARLVQEFHLSVAPGREELGLKRGIMIRPEDTMPLVLRPVAEE